MAHIRYARHDEIDPADRVDDDDNIIRIHGVHGRTLRHHFDLYVELMRGPGPLSGVQREMLGVVVSVENHCHY